MTEGKASRIDHEEYKRSLRKEPSDLIWKSDAIQALDDGMNKWYSNVTLRQSMRDAINSIPSAEKQGEWIDKGWHGDWQFETDGRGNCWHEYECSECGFHNKGGKSNYCPNCGCRMKGADDEKR